MNASKCIWITRQVLFLFTCLRSISVAYIVFFLFPLENNYLKLQGYIYLLYRANIYHIAIGVYYTFIVVNCYLFCIFNCENRHIKRRLWDKSSKCQFWYDLNEGQYFKPLNERNSVWILNHWINRYKSRISKKESYNSIDI